MEWTGTESSLGWGVKLCAPAGARHATGQPSAAWQCRTPFALGTQRARQRLPKRERFPGKGSGVRRQS